MIRTSIVLVAALGAAASAQAPDRDADAAYQEGRRLYDLREWDAAIAKFKEAYKLRPDAPSLFNIAQSNRLKGDCVEALSFYKTYRRNFSREKNIAKVEKFIVDMEACVKAMPAKPVEPVKPVEPAGPTELTVKTDPTIPPPTRIPPPPPARDPGKGKRVAGLVVGGVGVVSLGASAFFGLRARGASKDAQNAMPGETWNPAIETRGEIAARNSKIALGAGVALVGTGVVLYLVGRRRGAESSPSIAFVPDHEGATLVWARPW